MEYSGENGRLLTNAIPKIADVTKGKTVEIVLFTKVKPDEDIGNSLTPEDVIRL